MDASADPPVLELWLVNDDRAQLMVQKRLLGRMASVEAFLSPLEALAAARMKDSPPALVTDFHMPDMEGPELAALWCELHTNARVLVISASEISRAEQAKMDLLPGGSVKLLTSYRITELLEHAQNWFRPDTGTESSLPIQVGSSTHRVDASVLEKLGLLGGHLFVAKTVTRFLQTAPEKVRKMSTAFAEQDYVSMHELAHALKGSCGVVGALALSAAADGVEVATAEGQVHREQLGAQLRRLETECEATVAELEGQWR